MGGNAGCLVDNGGGTEGLQASPSERGPARQSTSCLKAARVGLSEQIRRLVFSLEERQREVPPSLAAKSSAHGKVCPTPPNEGKPVRWPNAVSGHVTSFCREIRGFLTWPWSIWPSEVAAEERRIL